MTKITTDFTTHQIGDSINGNPMYYADEDARTAINEIDVDLKAIQSDTAYIGNGYGVCSTASATAAKAVNIPHFILVKGGIVSVRFQNGISVNAPTLNVSSTGDKAIVLDGVSLPAGVVKENSTAVLQYDGTSWQVINVNQGVGTDDSILVDLGLPSGLKWATRNLDVTQANGFAASPYQYECSFVSWGNTEGHNPISTSAFQYNWGSDNEGPYASTPGAALTADAGLGYDAARVNLGGQWRMPTTTEFAELFNASNTKYINADGTDIASTTADKRTEVNGIKGLLLKSVNNGKTIFFPCSGGGNGTSWYARGSGGSYWASSLGSSADGRSLGFSSGGVGPQDNGHRYYGFAVRAVQ